MLDISITLVNIYVCACLCACVSVCACSLCLHACVCACVCTSVCECECVYECVCNPMVLIRIYYVYMVAFHSSIFFVQIVNVLISVINVYNSVFRNLFSAFTMPVFSISFIHCFISLINIYHLVFTILHYIFRIHYAIIQKLYDTSVPKNKNIAISKPLFNQSKRQQQ